MFSISRPTRYAAIGVAAVLAVGGAAYGGVEAFSASTTGSSTPSGPAALKNPPAVVNVAWWKNGQVPWYRPLTIQVANGKLTGVYVQRVDRVGLPGWVSGDATAWHSTQTLIPLEQYDAMISYVDLDGHKHLKNMAITAADSSEHLFATLSPDGKVVGVGQPVVVYFNHYVPMSQRAAVERRLSVATSPAVAGAWHWLGGDEVHWRPPSYWKPGTKITVHSDLTHLYIGKGIWGEGGAHSASFTIGASHISKVDVGNHVMRVYSGGQLIRTMPISAGRDKYPTAGGIHIALMKAYEVTMDSETVGIPRDSPDGYYEKVYWNVRITNGGAFVHAAPWSLASQGRANVSHGCINVSPANAEWFMNFSQIGDVVDVYNTSRGPDLWDAGTADWNISWQDWVASDPLHGQQAAQPAATPSDATTAPAGRY